jgi:hypothetical protein
MVLLVACGKGKGEDSPYPILDSGFPASSDDKLYWLDNDRVIFVSYGPKPKSLKEAQKHPRVPSIHIWNTRTNRVEPYAKGSHVCYSDGHIRYMPVETVADDPEKPVKVFWREGPLERPALVVLRFETEENYRVWFRAHAENPHTCRWVERPEFATGRAAIPLREGDGWLVADNEAKEWVWYRADGQVVRTGVPYWVHTAQWMQFAGGYFLKDTVDGRKRAQIDCHQYWWITPKNGISKGCQDIRPFKQWKGSGTSLQSTKVGILVESGGDYKKGQTGFFLELNNQLIRVIKGAEVIRTSPDGCRMAYVSINHKDGPLGGSSEETSLKATSLCGAN